MYDGAEFIDALGDHVCFTGIPEAYFKATGIKLSVRAWSWLPNSKTMQPVWENHPYATWDAPAKSWYKMTKDFNPDRAYEWNTVYKPVCIFKELTGKFISPDEVRPRLYYPRQRVKKRLIVNDEAGHPFRRGYPYMNALIASLKQDGWEIVILRNGIKSIIDAKATLSSVEIWGQYDVAQFTNIRDTLLFMGTAHAYIGYESGLAHVAGAYNIPYGIFAAANGVENNRHPSCIFGICACAAPCMAHVCHKRCMPQLPNYNDMIIEKLRAVRDA